MAILIVSVTATRIRVELERDYVIQLGADVVSGISILARLAIGSFIHDNTSTTITKEMNRH